MTDPYAMPGALRRGQQIGRYIDLLIEHVKRTGEPDPKILDRIEQALAEYERIANAAAAWRRASRGSGLVGASNRALEELAAAVDVVHAAGESVEREGVEVAETRNAGWVLRCWSCDITEAGMDEDDARLRLRDHEHQAGPRLGQVSS